MTKALAIAAVLLFCGVAPAQEPPARQAQGGSAPSVVLSGEIVIRNADHCTIDLIKREWLLEGNVEIVQGTTWLSADKVTVHWDEATRRIVAVELEGNVRARMLPPESSPGETPSGGAEGAAGAAGQ